MQRRPLCRPQRKSRQRRSLFQSQSIQLQHRSSWILVKSKMPSVSNTVSLISDFYLAQVMELGVRARVEDCESSGLLTASARATPGTKLQKNGWSGHET